MLLVISALPIASAIRTRRRTGDDVHLCAAATNTAQNSASAAGSPSNTTGNNSNATPPSTSSDSPIQYSEAESHPQLVIKAHLAAMRAEAAEAIINSGGTNASAAGQKSSGDNANVAIAPSQKQRKDACLTK